MVSLNNLIVRDIANQERGMYLISASTPPEMYELYAPSKDERRTWMNLIQQTAVRSGQDSITCAPCQNFIEASWTASCRITRGQSAPRSKSQSGVSSSKGVQAETSFPSSRLKTKLCCGGSEVLHLLLCVAGSTPASSPPAAFFHLLLVPPSTPLCCVQSSELCLK